MKILVFNGYYFPAKNYGGPATSLANMVAYCGEDVDFYIVARNHDLGKTEVFPDISDGWNKVGNAFVKYISDEEATLRNYLQMIDEISPDIVWSVGMYSRIMPKIMDYARSKQIAMIMSPRGAINKKAVAIKKYKKLPYLFFLKITNAFKNVFFHVTSQDEAEGAMKYLGIKEEFIFQIPNLPSKPLSQTEIEKKVNHLKVAYVSRINPTKNLLYAIQCVNKVSASVAFDIYGSCEDKAYWEKCKTEIATAKPDNVAIHYYGAAEPDKVAEIYAQHHCALLPTLTENYGHAIVEALQNGCPAIIPKGTTPWDRIDQNAGYVIDLAQQDQYVSALENYASMDQAEYNTVRERTIDFIQRELKTADLTEQYLCMLRNVIKH